MLWNEKSYEYEVIVCDSFIIFTGTFEGILLNLP